MDGQSALHAAASTPPATTSSPASTASSGQTSADRRRERGQPRVQRRAAQRVGVGAGRVRDHADRRDDQAHTGGGHEQPDHSAQPPAGRDDPHDAGEPEQRQRHQDRHGLAALHCEVDDDGAPGRDVQPGGLRDDERDGAPDEQRDDAGAEPAPSRREPGHRPPTGRNVPATATARRIAAALLRHSVSSATGSESATIPAPAWT